MAEQTREQNKSFPKSGIKGIEFVDESRDSHVDKKIDGIVVALKAKGIVDPLFADYFRDPRLFSALPSEIQNNDQLLFEYVENTEKFNNLLYSEREKRSKGDMSGLFGDEVHLAETEHAGGRIRRAEDGYRINLEYLRSVGINPERLLFFRVTQPMEDQPKPEYYWTSDYREVVRGLGRELGAQRKTSIILISDLQTINQNKGLIQDINDDSGLAVRQIGNGPFDQHNALAKISNL